MDIKQLLTPKGVSFDFEASTKEEAIDGLIDILHLNGKLYNKEEFKKAVLAREALFSTGVGMGIAIPHGKDKSVKEPCIVFALSAKGVDFEAKDGTLAHLLFLIAVPEDSDDMHLRALVTISRKLMHENVRQMLMESSTFEEVLKAFGE